MHKFLTFLLVLLALFSFNGVDASIRAVDTSLQAVKSEEEVKLTPLFSEKGEALLKSLHSFRELSVTSLSCQDTLMTAFCNAFKKKLEPLNKEIEEYTNTLDVMEANKVYRKYREDISARIQEDYKMQARCIHDRHDWIGN